MRKILEFFISDQFWPSRIPSIDHTYTTYRGEKMLLLLSQIESKLHWLQGREGGRIIHFLKFYIKMAFPRFFLLLYDMDVTFELKIH